MLTSSTLKIVLPLLPPSDLVEFEKYFPLEFLNGGLRDLVVCALENQEGEGYFISACFNKMDERLAYFDEGKYSSTYELFFTDRAYNKEIKIMLSAFFAMYNRALRQVLGQMQFNFVRVLSYRVNQGIYVELTCEPLSEILGH